MGLITKNKIEDYCKPNQETPWFSKMSTQNHFQAILILFHIVNNESISPKDDPNYRPNMKIKSIVDHINRLSMHYYTPNQNISIDESLVGFKVEILFGNTCQTSILACSVTSYILKMYVYKVSVMTSPVAGVLVMWLLGSWRWPIFIMSATIFSQTTYLRHMI